MADDTRFRDLYDLYCQDLDRRERATADARSCFRLYLFVFSEELVAGIRTVDVVAFVATLIEAGLSPKYVRKVHGCLRAALSIARARGLIEHNPAARMPSDTLPPNETRVDFDAALEIPTIDEVLRYISNPRIPLYRRALVALLALAGLRLGEALALTWDDVDTRVLPLWRITICRSWSRKEGRLKPPKTKRWKTIPAHPVLAALLRAMREEFRTDFGRDAAPDDLIVAHPDRKTGEPRHYPDNSALRQFRDHLEDCGIDPRRRLHSLRHFFDTTFVDLGATERTVTSMTHPPKRATGPDTYVHTTWAAKCRAISLLDAGPQLELFKDPPP